MKTIAIAEDDDDLREALGALLFFEGYDVRMFADGEALWFALENDLQPDVLVLDLEMPGWSGLELLTMLRDRNGAPAVIVVTGHGDLCEEARELGALAVFEKPYAPDALCHAVDLAEMTH